MVSPVAIDVKFSTWREEAACLDLVDEVSFFPDPEDLVGIAQAHVRWRRGPVGDFRVTDRRSRRRLQANR